MDIKYLREFITVGQSRSLQAASKKLFLVPSTLSRHLTALENEVGATLVYRTTTDFSLTPEGEVFLEKAFGIVEAYDQALAATESKARASYPTVLIGGHLRSSMAQKITMNTISYLEHTHARVTAMVYDLHTSGSIAAMNINDPSEAALQQTVELSVLIDNGEPMDGFEMLPLWTEPFRVAISEHHPLAQVEGPIDLAQLKDGSVVLSTSYPAFSSNCIDACLACGFEPNIARHVHRCWGDMYVDRDPHDFYLVPRDDSGRMPPTALSGLVIKKLVNQEAKLNIICAYPQNAKDEVVLVAQAMQEVAEIMKADRLARKARREHTQTVLP